MTLTRPVAANSPLQSYFVDSGFAAAANARDVQRWSGGPDGPWLRSAHDELSDAGGLGRVVVRRLWNALMVMVCLWLDAGLRNER